MISLGSSNDVGVPGHVTLSGVAEDPLPEKPKIIEEHDPLFANAVKWTRKDLIVNSTLEEVLDFFFQPVHCQPHLTCRC